MAEQKKETQGKACEVPMTMQTVYVPIAKEKEKVVVCEVCGHVNPENTALCMMCSNYLI